MNFRLAFFLASPIIFFSFLIAQNTYVPDDQFENSLIELGYDDVLDDYVLTENISGVTYLDLFDKESVTLLGLRILQY